MEWRIEVVFVPVADVELARAFYRDQLGFRLDFDHRFSDGSMSQQSPGE